MSPSKILNYESYRVLTEQSKPDTNSSWGIEPEGEWPPNTEDLVMAWATDRETGMPCYIRDLGKNRQGGKCNCECPSCEAPLIAVNAAKENFRKRPHFRHPKGAVRDSCLVLAARIALFGVMKAEGEIILPKRIQSANLAGLSGHYYNAWATAEAEKVRIADFVFKDRVSAILTLDDGRQLFVTLLGTLETDDLNLINIPVIKLSCDDKDVAGMNMEQIKSRLTLVMEKGAWCSHWRDEQLREEAELLARQEAEEAWDWLDESLLPREASEELRRETLLHLTAKKILEKQKLINVPGLFATVTDQLPDKTPITKSTRLLETYLRLSTVVLEKSLGLIKPDVLATPDEPSPYAENTLLIEVTVTNHIDQERLDRIRNINLPTLEIDISRMGGKVTEAEFANIVIHELVLKRWLHHPWIDSEQTRLNGLLKEEIAVQAELEIRTRAEEEAMRLRHAEVKTRSISDWIDTFIDAMLCHATAREMVKRGDESQETLEYIKEKIKSCAEAFCVYGYSEAVKDIDFLAQDNPIERIIRIMRSEAVYAPYGTVWNVIEKIIVENHPETLWHTYYLMAINIYKPPLTNEQVALVDIWQNKVNESLAMGDGTYKRQQKFDRLLRRLFIRMTEQIVPMLSGDLSGII